MFTSAFELNESEVKERQFDHTLHDVGYEGRSIEEFITLLKEHNIHQLADLRERPVSRKSGFGKNQFISKLEENGITYVHFPILGSPFEIRQKLRDEKNYDLFFEEYEAHINRYPQVMKELIQFISKDNTVLLCFEKDHTKCHRTVISDKLAKIGIKSIHV